MIAPTAQAFSVVRSCGDFADNVSGTSYCEYGTTNNDFLGSDKNLFQVNKDTMFGKNDWEFFDKKDVVNQASGSWNFSDRRTVKK